MDEVDMNAVEIGAEMIDRVQFALSSVPIEPVGPVREQPSQVREVSPVFPRSARGLVRPARVADALSQVRQDVGLDLDRERGDV
jgi:hypothetical protein